MQQHGSKYFARRPPPPSPWGGVKSSTFSEHGHVAYKIKGNGECSNKVANIFFFLSFSIYCLALAFEHYRQVYIVHSGLQDESLQVTISKLP